MMIRDDFDRVETLRIPAQSTVKNGGRGERAGAAAGQAKAYLAEAMARDPTLVDANANMGFLLACQGRWAKSLPWYERAIWLKPSYAGRT